MDRINLTPEDIDEMHRRTRDRSVTPTSKQKDALEIGTLGEIAFERWCDELGSITWERQDTANHDYIIAGKERWEIKTKKRTVPPRPDYDVQIFEDNRQKLPPDWYVFVSLLSGYSAAWVVGRYLGADYWRDAEFYPEGFILPGGRKCIADTTVLLIEDLKAMP